MYEAIAHANLGAYNERELLVRDSLDVAILHYAAVEVGNSIDCRGGGESSLEMSKRNLLDFVVFENALPHMKVFDNHHLGKVETISAQFLDVGFVFTLVFAIDCCGNISLSVEMICDSSGGCLPPCRCLHRLYWCIRFCKKLFACINDEELLFFSRTEPNHNQPLLLDRL